MITHLVCEKLFQLVFKLSQEHKEEMAHHELTKTLAQQWNALVAEEKRVSPSGMSDVGQIGTEWGLTDPKCTKI